MLTMVLSALVVCAGAWAQSGEGEAAVIAAMPNAAIVLALQSSGFAESTAIMTRLGDRPDHAVGSIIDYLRERTTGPSGYENEYLLRLALVSVFFPNGSAVADASRIGANRAALTRFAEALPSIADPQTRRLVVLLMPDVSAADAAKRLAAEGAHLIRLIERSNGSLGPDEMSEALAFVETARTSGGPACRDEIIRMIELSRDALFVRTARAALGTLE